jgi:hypothetical protein
VKVELARVELTALIHLQPVDNTVRHLYDYEVVSVENMTQG